MQHVSELRFLKAFDAERYQVLLPYLTALPEITAINLNTASKEILSILGDGLTDSQVNEILSARGKKGIQQLETITPLLERLNIKKEQVTLDSNYFLSVALASIDGQQLSVYTILKRQTDSKNNTTVRILSQRFNTN
jgi:general secretion pathway protein K